MIIEATFVSLWDGDCYISTSCKVDTDTKEVFNIEISSVDSENLHILEKEFIIIDKIAYPVYNYKKDMEYWYE